MIISVILGLVLIVVPHPDDEVTLLPLIQEYGDQAVVLIVTDGSASRYCNQVDDCVAERERSTRSFLAEMAPEAQVIFARMPDGRLTKAAVGVLIQEYCVGCSVWAAGSDYGHPDHNAVRDAVADVHGSAYDGKRYHDPDAIAAVERWYGWLGFAGNYERIEILGLQTEA